MNESAFIWIVVIWMAAIGGSVGSFLNVVIYRLPAGMNLSYPGSHCPRCGKPIRWHDNVPVLGWLMLRGRCRDCHCWIPIRYPAVEGTVAILFLLFAMVEGASMGANLPARPVSVVDGLIYPPLSIWELAGIMAVHLLLLCTLLSASLIRNDGHEVPARLFTPVFLVGIAAPLFSPTLHPQPAAILASGPTPAIVDVVAGIAAGTALGLLAWKILEPTRRPDLMWGTAIVGVVLGWQSVFAVSGATIAAGALSKLVASFWQPWRRIAPVVWLGLGTMFWILLWEPLVDVLSVVFPVGA